MSIPELNSTQRIADRALGAPQYYGMPIRLLILDEMRRAAGNLPNAIKRMEILQVAVERVLDALQLEQADAQIAKGTPLEAAAWFIENVPPDAIWRSDAYFMLRERMREASDDPTVTRVAMRGDVQIDYAIMDNERVVKVCVQKLVEAGYWVEPTMSKGWEAHRSSETDDNWRSGTTNSRWAAWALAQEHFTGGKS